MANYNFFLDNLCIYNMDDDCNSKEKYLHSFFVACQFSFTFILLVYLLGGAFYHFFHLLKIFQRDLKFSENQNFLILCDNFCKWLKFHRYSFFKIIAMNNLSPIISPNVFFNNFSVRIICIYPTPPLKLGHLLKWSLTGLNSVFSFS